MKTNWEMLIEDAMQKALRYFSQPVIPKHAIIHDSVELGMPNTAWMELGPNQTHVIRPFLEELVQQGCSASQAAEGIIVHEIGHYSQFPRDIAQAIMWGEYASSKKHGAILRAEWGEYLNDLPILAPSGLGHSLASVHKASVSMILEGYDFTSEQREYVMSLGGDPDKVSSDLRGCDIVLLREAYYQHSTRLDLGVVLEGMNASVAQEVYDLDIITLAKHLPAVTGRDDKTAVSLFLQLAEIQERVLDAQDTLKKELGCQFPDLEKMGYKPLAAGDGSESGSGGRGYGGFGDEVDLSALGDDQIEDALSELIRKLGKWRYDHLKKFIEKEIGRTLPESTKPQARGIGLHAGDLTFNDDQIPYYDKLSRTYGLYIIPRKVMVDSESSHREGQTTFEVGDDMRLFNPFPTGGKMLPQISRRYELVPEIVEDTGWKIPDLMWYLDTSGSMKHPKEGSDAVLAGFILSRQYHANGAKVGGCNFSTDIAMLEPSRDLDKVYSLLCAYYGGGTALNISKIHAYFNKMNSSSLGLMDHMSEKDLRHLVEGLDTQTRHNLLDKDIILDVQGRTKTTYEKMDHVFITDGGIANVHEVLEYTSLIGKGSRNILYIMQNDEFAQEVRGFGLPNTFVYSVNSPADLRKMVIGQTKSLGGA